MRTVYVYLVSPIDYWEGFVLEESFDVSRTHKPGQYEAFRAKAFEVAKKNLSWDGDISVGPFISMIPDGNWSADALPLLVWKQSGNGSTFVASPYPLPWLQKHALDMTAGKI